MDNNSSRSSTTSSVPSSRRSICEDGWVFRLGCGSSIGGECGTSAYFNFVAVLVPGRGGSDDGTADAAAAAAAELVRFEIPSDIVRCDVRL